MIGVYQLASGAKWGFLADDAQMVSGFLMMVIMLILTYYVITRARSGFPIPHIRKIAGLEALDEAIGRATEMGRPVHISSFRSTVDQQESWAFWVYLAHAAKLCAQYDTRIINCVSDEISLAIHEEIIKTGYLEAGRPDAYNPDDVRYMSNQQFAWVAGVCGMLERERPAAQLLIGRFFAESLILAEQGNLIGSIQIAANDSSFQLPFFVATCDYVLIGEELYVGAAYISRDPVMTGTVVAEDVIKMALFGIMILGTLLETFKAEGADNILRTWFLY